MNWGYHKPSSGILRGALEANKEECLDKLKKNLDEAFKDVVTTPAKVAEPLPLTIESLTAMMKKFGGLKTSFESLTPLVMDVSASLDGLKYLKYMPTQDMSFAPINTGDVGEYSYLYKAMAYMDKFGKLPCGKSQRSRIKKKRTKRIIEWFEGVR